MLKAELISACHRYKAFADWLVREAGGSDKLVHLNVGLLLWVVAALLLRRPLRSPVPLLVVVTAQIANEVIDYNVRTGWSLRDTLLDTLATIGWPFVLWLVLSIAGRKRR